jgi:hypothetical protein
MIHLIYSGGGNKRFLEIALYHGYKYGAQIPETIYENLFFADQNWKKPNKNAYINGLKRHEPHMATVLDLERENQFDEVMQWAEEISEIVDKVLIIPKVSNLISKIPKLINGKEIILAFSVPTKYGKTNVDILEFSGWRIHLLGGSPHSQLDYYQQFKQIAEVYSADGNYFRKLAVRFCKYWVEPGKWIQDNHQTRNDAHYECFSKSCENIKACWDKLG